MFVPVHACRHLQISICPLLLIESYMVSRQLLFLDQLMGCAIETLPCLVMWVPSPLTYGMSDCTFHTPQLHCQGFLSLPNLDNSSLSQLLFYCTISSQVYTYKMQYISLHAMLCSLNYVMQQHFLAHIVMTYMHIDFLLYSVIVYIR